MITKEDFKRIINLLSVYKREIFITTLLTLLISTIGIIDSLLLSYLIDNVLYSNGKITLLTIAIIMILMAVFQLSLKGFKSLLIQKVSFKMDIDLMQNFYNKVLKIKYSFFEKHKTGELTARLNDTRLVRNAFSEGLISIITNTIMFIVVAFALIKINKTLFLIQLLSVIVLSIVVFVFGKYFSKEYPVSMEKYADLQSFITESFSGIEAIKTNPANKAFINNYTEKQSKSLKISWNIGEHCILQNSYCAGIEKITSVLLIVTGCLLVMKEKMSLGQVVSFISLSGFFTSSMGILLDLQAGVQEAFAAINRLFEVLDEKVEDEETDNDVPDLVPEIEFQNVCFSYTKENILYENFNIAIKPGEWISFVGRTGCGKTTFTKLLLKLYKPQNGIILWNKQNLQNYNTTSVRSRIAYIPQEVVLFSGTILENITMFDEKISRDLVTEVIKKVGIYEKINRLENGLDTVVGERGFSLSGGEKQKIAICRAMIKNPFIIIMDEATSNLDVNSEKEIIKLIEALREEGKTIISIAHRLTTVEKCDKIYVLDNGKIMENGTYTELKKAKGFFSELLKNNV